MTAESINVSKLLTECADWCSNTPPYEEYYPDEDKFQAWAAAIRSIAIPEPVGERDETN